MRYLVFLGSVRDSHPPRPARLGLRVARACTALLEESGAEATLIDPLDIERSPVFKPHFAYHQRNVPADLDALAERISAADGYVMVSPEYNHSMSPALADLLNHFGSSRFAFKPSAIASYSAGQWGGARAATGMRTFLSELGCLPVSAMIHVPHAHEALAEDGSFTRDPTAWRGYLGRTLCQLDWWAEAARNARAARDPRDISPAFQTAPSQRNPP